MFLLLLLVVTGGGNASMFSVHIMHHVAMALSDAMFATSLRHDRQTLTLGTQLMALLQLWRSSTMAAQHFWHARKWYECPTVDVEQLIGLWSVIAPSCTLHSKWRLKLKFSQTPKWLVRLKNQVRNTLKSFSICQDLLRILFYWSLAILMPLKPITRQEHWYWFLQNPGLRSVTVCSRPMPKFLNLYFYFICIWQLPNAKG